ncbi:hypothetical protein EYC98_02475 [Halieaceae bacterium IMCC14734]|uniref:Uncharacterized protein n=1 Tax=Candidatus Litorirhabdus singularis TaxID=2518993 RepID=A0ABT3TE82_9GAMM|nr:hypothetical protein [Candidatus Litorirhabdus singularis]MCX2979724.1 hypothetical protein [Candidatus Litorirhabdus singularis]
MGQRESESNENDGAEDFFDPEPGDAVEEMFAADALESAGKGRLAELRRRAEQRLEDKRLRDELDYLETDWDDI